MALPIVVLVAAAVLAGVLRTPVHSATARLSVARIDATSPTGPGFQDGVENVANAYARLVTAQAVQAETARALAVDEAAVSGRVSGAPVPASPLFEITATGPSPDSAVRLANASANALRTYVAQLTATNPEADRLFERFSVASRQRAAAESAVQQAAAAARRTPGMASRERLSRARAAAEAATLRAQALSDLYRTSLAQSASANIVQIVNPATRALSDRRGTLLRYVAVATVAGVLLGLALALVAAGAPLRTRPSSPEPGST